MGAPSPRHCLASTKCAKNYARCKIAFYEVIIARRKAGCHQIKLWNFDLKPNKIFISFLSELLCTFIIHQTHYKNSDWLRAFNQFTIAHVKFNVCLVTKPLGVFSSETEWLNASLLFLRMNYMCKCIINNYSIRFSHDIMNYQNLVVITQTSV